MRSITLSWRVYQPLSRDKNDALRGLGCVGYFAFCLSMTVIIGEADFGAASTVRFVR